VTWYEVTPIGDDFCTIWLSSPWNTPSHLNLFPAKETFTYREIFCFWWVVYQHFLTFIWHSIVFISYCFVFFTCLSWVLPCLGATDLGSFPNVLSKWRSLFLYDTCCLVLEVILSSSICVFRVLRRLRSFRSDIESWATRCMNEKEDGR
jgi:hypothetical protein